VKEGVCIMASMKEDRGELDLTRQVGELKKRVQEAEGETSIVKTIGINSPEMKEKDKLIQELRMRIRDMLLISEQHRNILGSEITNRKRLEKEVKDLKVQMSEYLSVRTRGAGSVS
jgi:ABC-type phosphate transport system auxiliary subunit